MELPLVCPCEDLFIRAKIELSLILFRESNFSVGATVSMHQECQNAIVKKLSQYLHCLNPSTFGCCCSCRRLPNVTSCTTSSEVSSAEFRPLPMMVIRDFKTFSAPAATADPSCYRTRTTKYAVSRLAFNM